MTDKPETQPDTIICSLPNGYTVEIIPDTRIIIHEVWEQLFYERDYKIRKGDVVVDLGANQGLFSLYAAHCKATVYAVEPDKKNYALLCTNITRNKLEKKISPLFYAMGREQGTVALYTPQSDHITASGLITTSAAQLESLPIYNDIHVITSEVEALSLSGLLDKIDVKRISLLKIDIEGAELDVLAGACSRDLELVERIVMETHAAYPERELFYLVQKLGFTVLSYNKLAGIFPTGYLYAVRSPKRIIDAYNKPVAILSVPPVIIRSNAVTARADSSFSTGNQAGSTLRYCFSIDGEQGQITWQSKKDICFAKQGPHHIMLHVFDTGEKGRPSAVSYAAGNVQSEDMDCAESTVWVFTEDYGSSASAFNLPAEGESYEITVSKQQEFVIPASCLPKNWQYGALALRISLYDLPNGPESGHIRFCFNGREQDLNKWYQELIFPHFPNQSDFCFTLKATQKSRVILKWSPLQEADIEKEARLTRNKDGKLVMGKKSLPYVCHIENKACFVISRDHMQKTWNPQLLKVCVSVHDSDPLGTELEGELVYGTRSVRLEGWYREICLCQSEIPPDIEFSITVPKRRVYKITWWPE